MTISADLSGKRALVTGASSDGFGAHFARLLARSGAEVIVSARRLPALEALVEDIRTNGGAAHAVAMDVTNVASVEAAVAAAGPLDILANNAGVAVTKAFLDHDEADYDFVMDTNLKGCWAVGSAVARSMRDAGRGGSIINTASITGYRTGPGIAPYAASKAGVIHLTNQMAVELARYGIRVNAIAPGFFLTDINRDQLDGVQGDLLKKRVPMRRYGEYHDLDGAMLLLASDASAFMTGSCIAVDGGHSVNAL